MSPSNKERPAASPSADAQAGFDETLDGSGGPPRTPADPQPRRSMTMDGAASAEPIGTRPVVTVRATRLGRFTLLHQLGEGGMGSVFAAYDQQLDRRVALKLMHQRTAGNTLQRQRTLQEARAVARISHLNVISVYDVGEIDEHVYIAMEYVDGETLAAWQARGSHSWRQLLDRYLLAGAGLQAAHAAGVVHRDFKPENVLCGKDGRLRVADFGLARIGWESEQATPPGSDGAVPANADSPGRLTQLGVISGTPGYMSPEQYRGGNVDAYSDQWSFCAALFEALYGYLPYGGETLREKAENVSGTPLPPPRNTTVPEDVHRALLRGLSADTSMRFPSMAELMNALALEQGDDAAGRALSRNRLLKAFVVIGVSGAGLIVRQAQGNLTPLDLLIGAGLLLFATLSMGFVFRKTLLDNRFHRSMWFLCMVHMVENAMQRLLALKLGMPMGWLFSFEMIVIAANIAICGAFLIPWLRWIWPVPIAIAALFISGLVPLRILSGVYFLLVVVVAVAWTRTAKQSQRPINPGDSGTLILSRNRRTSEPSVRPLRETPSSAP